MTGDCPGRATMNFLVVRSFDHAGFYETRFVLMVVALLASLYFLRFHRDPRYVFLFSSGAVFQTLVEASYACLGLRGPDHAITLFGVKMEGASKVLMQGLTEGGVLAVMSFWFADLVASPHRRKQTLEAFILICSVMLGMSVVVGFRAAGAEVTSARPMFGPYAMLTTLLAMAAAVELASMRDGGRRALMQFCGGLILFSVLTFAPLNITQAQFIAPAATKASPAALPAAFQALLFIWTHLIEDGAAKMCCFAVPFALGMVDLGSQRGLYALDDPEPEAYRTTTSVGRW